MEFIGWFIVIILLKFILIDLDGISLKDLFYNPNKSNDKGKQKQTKEEKLYIENWVMNLRSGTEVEFRQCKIKFTEEKVTINDFTTDIKFIDKFIFKQRLVKVQKYNYYTTGGLMSIDTMTPDEYYRDLEFNMKHYYPNDRYKYSFIREYSLSIKIVKKSSQKNRTDYKDFSIGYGDINYKDEQLLLELNNYLTEKKN